MTNQISTSEREAIDAVIAAGKTTKFPAGKARGVTKKTAPMTTTKPTKAQQGKAPAKRKQGTTTKRKAPEGHSSTQRQRPASTFTTVDLAAQEGINAKTLRARIRRNIDKWEPLFKDGEKHVFADNATTRKRVAALLDA